MKLAPLKAVGHNIADSLSSGIGLMIGCYATNVYAEAEGEEDGFVIVDFLTGNVSGKQISAGFRKAVKLYNEALEELCGKHGIHSQDFKALEVRFGTDRVYGPHYTVTVRTVDDKISTDRYIGISGRRLQRRAQVRA